MAADQKKSTENSQNKSQAPSVASEYLVQVEDKPKEKSGQTSGLLSLLPKNKKVLIIVGVASFFVFLLISSLLLFLISSNQNNSSLEEQVYVEEVTPTPTPDVRETNPPIIENIGIHLENYNKFTFRAGDFEFSTGPLTFNRIFVEYGFEIPSELAEGESKINPQPTYILPMGTKVLALVDGTVDSVTTLYSRDYSIHIVSEQTPDLVYELEHVINPTVKEGDVVKAGDVVGEVSDFDSHNYGGFGLVEIGVLVAGNTPKHLCPYEFLHESIRDTIQDKFFQLYLDWEDFKSNKDLYNEWGYEVRGCLTLDPIEG